MSNYSPAYPADVQVDAGVKEFITKFYGVSDTPGKNQEWLDFFRDDATLVMALQEASGKTGEFSGPGPWPGPYSPYLHIYVDARTALLTGDLDILKVREGMWEKVQARRHTVYQVFPANFGGAKDGDEEVELMLYGDVVYRLKGSAEGEETKVDWAGRARLRRAAGGGEWKFAYYRVYLQR